MCWQQKHFLFGKCFLFPESANGKEKLMGKRLFYIKFATRAKELLIVHRKFLLDLGAAGVTDGIVHD